MRIRLNSIPAFNKNFFKNLVGQILGGVQNDLWNRINPAEGYSYAKSDPDDFRPGDVEIEHVTLVSGDGKRVWPITDQVKEIHIFESIIYPTMFCELTIADSARLYENYTLTTNEFVTFTIKTMGREKSVDYRFAVNTIGNKVVNENNKMVTYTLQLVSPEFKASAANFIASKQFKGTITELIESILKEDLATRKRIIVEPSTGIIDKTVGPRYPFAIIHEHYLDADNRRDNNGVYVFFENQRGYNLVTYEKLLKDGRKTLDRGGSDRSFVFTPLGNADAADVKFRNILSYSQSKFNDAIELLTSGGLNSTAMPYDFATGEGQLARYQETKDGASLPTSDTNGTAIIGTDFINQYERNSVVNKLIAVNYEVRPNTNVAEVIVKRNAFLQKLQQIEAQILIYGDTDLAVGDVIECSFPTSSDAEDDPGETRLDSGYYLITHLRHMILNSDRPQHAISCNLMKSGMKGN
jgi:hypothetical protein